MISGALLYEARRRAGLSQAELGRRVERPQTQIARWERGAVLPSLETLRELIGACGLELTVGLAVADDSYGRDVAERLALAPATRLSRALASANAARRLHRGAESEPFDPLPILRRLDGAGVDFVLIGPFAGVLRGSPLLPVAAAVSIVPTEDAANMARLETSDPSLEVVPRPPGTFGYRDLRRDAELVPLDGVEVAVASLRDLVRIAEASPDPEQHAQVVALRATLELASRDRLADSA